MLVVSGLVAASTYAYGLSAGAAIDAGDFCMLRGVPEGRLITHELLPISARCVALEGRSLELVPWWVNPVAIGSAAICLGSIGKALPQSSPTRSIGA